MLFLKLFLPTMFTSFYVSNGFPSILPYHSGINRDIYGGFHCLRQSTDIFVLTTYAWRQCRSICHRNRVHVAFIFNFLCGTSVGCLENIRQSGRALTHTINLLLFKSNKPWIKCWWNEQTIRASICCYSKNIDFMFRSWKRYRCVRSDNCRRRKCDDCALSNGSNFSHRMFDEAKSILMNHESVTVYLLVTNVFVEKNEPLPHGLLF